jgi:hypothetical protein
MKVLVVAILVVGRSAAPQSLDLPPRAPDAQGGSAFARSIAGLPLKEREERILAEVKAGNVPAFLRRLVPVTVTRGGIKATYHVAPDYLAIGSDGDYFLAPMTPFTAQKIADLLGCTLPTPRMVDDIYVSAKIKMTPSPIPPSPAMTTVPVFLRHDETVRNGRGQEPLGVLVAGHKKDVVIANKVFAATGKVAIYGWHKPDGRPIQPLYTGHTAAWVDYSHGIRLVGRKMVVDGKETTIDEVLANPTLAPLLSDEGVMKRTRYEFREFPAEARPAPRAIRPGERSGRVNLATSAGAHLAATTVDGRPGARRRWRRGSVTTARGRTGPSQPGGNWCRRGSRPGRSRSGRS